MALPCALKYYYMIIGIGCDIVDHQITKTLNWESDAQTLQRFFTAKELSLYSKSKAIRFLAGRFAAKEALLKSLGTGICDGLSLTEIQILQLENGSPIVQIEGAVKESADKLGVTKWHVTISHTSVSSAAFVIAEGN